MSALYHTPPRRAQAQRYPENADSLARARGASTALAGGFVREVDQRSPGPISWPPKTAGNLPATARCAGAPGVPRHAQGGCVATMTSCAPSNQRHSVPVLFDWLRARRSGGGAFQAANRMRRGQMGGVPDTSAWRVGGP